MKKPEPYYAIRDVKEYPNALVLPRTDGTLQIIYSVNQKVNDGITSISRGDARLLIARIEQCLRETSK